METSSGARRIRHWWQARPMAGLTVGWIVIGLIGWRILAVLLAHHGQT